MSSTEMIVQVRKGEEASGTIVLMKQQVSIIYDSDWLTNAKRNGVDTSVWINQVAYVKANQSGE